MVDGLQAQAGRTRLRIPLLWGIDAVHGHNNVWGATLFPHRVGLGATRDPQLVAAVAAASAREVVATGIRWTFAPAVSVCRDPRWGRCYESFSEHTGIVNALTAEILGYQEWSSDVSDPTSALPGDVLVAATAKHYIGDGGTTGGHDQGDTEVSEEELRRVHLPPYVHAMRHGVSALMVSYSSWNGFKMHGSRYLITDVLKRELNFSGLVVSDWAAIQQLPGNWTIQVRTAINAGIDMVMVPDTYKEFIETLIEEVRAGNVALERIDDAVSRILAMKRRLGLFENACSNSALLPLLGAKPHRALARRAVRESLVLLKNERRDGGGTMFPLMSKRGMRVLVTGSHANDIGLQCGGWSIYWQGLPGPITPGKTVLDGISAFLEGSESRMRHMRLPRQGEQGDLGIVITGEQPYAEYFGDDSKLVLDAAAETAILVVCQAMPCVVVLLSGRPLTVEHLLPHIDVLVAAWLPGTEGDGIAEVLLGDGYDFAGRLPVSWFRNVSQLPMSAGSAHYDPLFPLGFGLTKSGHTLPMETLLLADRAGHAAQLLVT
eukprot:SM000081S22614  [mRNA]  locus=s81:11834:14128:- [translate_table: standard]